MNPDPPIPSASSPEPPANAAAAQPRQRDATGNAAGAPEHLDEPTARGQRHAGTTDAWVWRFCHSSDRALAIASVLIWRAVTSPCQAARATPATPHPAAVPVAVARVTREDLYNEVTIPAEFRPYLEVELHAKVSGYVQRDEGGFRRPGQSGPTPGDAGSSRIEDEVGQRDRHAAESAEADYTNAHCHLPALVGGEPAASESGRAAGAGHRRGQGPHHRRRHRRRQSRRGESTKPWWTTRGSRRPFDGVITQRYADPGALIQAGTASDTQSMPLVWLSDNYRLRLDFPVSVDHTSRTSSLGTRSRCGSNRWGQDLHRHHFAFHPEGGRGHAHDDHGDRGAQPEAGIGAGHVCHAWS